MFTVKKYIIISIVSLTVIVAAAMSYYHFVHKQTHLDGVAKEIVTNNTVGLDFSYTSGAEGFSLVKPPVGENGLLAAYVLIPSKEYTDFQASSEAREAPASISVLVYAIDAATSTDQASGTERIDRITRLQNWAIDNDTLTSFTRAKAAPDIVEIDGIKALHYQADGLYQQDIFLVSYQNRAYMFTGQYDNSADFIGTEFTTFIESISFD